MLVWNTTAFTVRTQSKESSFISLKCNYLPFSAWKKKNILFPWDHSWRKKQELCWVIASTKYLCSGLCRLKGCRLFSPAWVQTLTPRLLFPFPSKTSRKSQLNQAMHLLERVTQNRVIFPYSHLKRHFKASTLSHQCMGCLLPPCKTASSCCKQSSGFYQSRFHHRAAHLLICISLPESLSVSQPLVLQGPFVPQTSSWGRGRM